MASSRAMPVARFAVPVARFAAPHAPLALTAAPPLLALAARLWEPGGPGTIPMRLRVAAGPALPELPERALAWTHSERRLEARIPGGLGVAVDLSLPRISGFVSRALLDSDPALVARLLLEAPVAALLTFRLTALHAGAVVGARGACVIRGAAGAGKSTLVAACHRVGLGVLSDESLLVDPTDPELLVATVRDLALRPDSPALAGLVTRAAFSGGEEKRRVDLFSDASPRDRTARRCATILLGSRSPAPARLVPLDAVAFLAEFPRGALPQESWGAGPARAADAWAGRATFRLEGHDDLAGAVSHVRALTS